jgi:hypothetical protein
LAWANEVIRELQSLELVCTLKKQQLEAVTAKEKVAEITFNTSILVERGRLFFKNAKPNDHGQLKEVAYRGYRAKVLDPIIVAHRIACDWPQATEEKREEMGLLAREYRRKFVSLMQREVGRVRTASAATRAHGESLQLSRLLGDQRKRSA